SVGNCLLCMACVANCAGQVNMVDIVLKSRAYMISEKSLSRVKALALKTLTCKRKYQDMGAASARAAQLVLMAKLPEKSGLRFKLSLPRFFEIRQKGLPPIAKHPFIGRQDREYKAAHQTQEVLLFVGCAGNYIYTQIAKKTIQLLNRLDVGVKVLSSQGCCGAPAHAHADTNTLETLAKNNIHAFSTPLKQPIITICSSGGLMLKKQYPQIFQGTRLAARAVAVSRRTMDISEYLTEQVGIEKIISRIKQKITLPLTYHDPCHLARGQQITAQPRALLKAVCHHYIEMPDAQLCCGLGGTYGITHTQISEQILGKKIQQVAGMTPVPAHLATGCPACIMQLTFGIENRALRVKVGHIVEFLWQALV
ncbi:MAG: (Fe-S)-binding protein, partial [Proteobacteria bacterium]|nr:(Fe-S)-binding protein [Pseudomonadota bacterium]